MSSTQNCQGGESADRSSDVNTTDERGFEQEQPGQDRANSSNILTLTPVLAPEEYLGEKL